MDARDLRVFEAVARHAGMNRAALELNTVQSNVTTRIRLLESELGTALFERHTKGMKLTPAGARLLPHAFEVRTALENARRAVMDDGTPRGPLGIGSRKSTAALHLTSIVSSYIGTYPLVDVAVRIETSSVLLEMVLERKLEGAFIAGPIEHPDLVSEVIFDEELVLLSGPDIADLSQIDPAHAKMIVLGKGSYYHQHLESILEQRGLKGLRLLELGTLEVIMGCVATGLGVTLLPKGVVGPLQREGKVRTHAVAGQDCRVQTLFVRRRDGFISSALSAFLENSRRYAAEPVIN